MPTNAYRSDADPAAKVLRFLAPEDTTNTYPVFTVNNKKLSWSNWDAGTIATAINARAFPELADVVATAEGNDVVLTGAENDDWYCQMTITPTVTVELSEGNVPKDKIHRLNFDGATAGTYKLWLEGAGTTAAIDFTLGTADIRSKINAISGPGDFVVEEVGDEVLITTQGTYATQDTQLSFVESTLTKPVGSILITRTEEPVAARHETVLVGMPANETERFDYLGSFDYMSSDMTAAELQERMRALAGSEVNVYGGQIDPDTGRDAAMFVIEFADRPGGPDILDQASPNNFFTYGSALRTDLINAATPSREYVMFDTTAGAIELEYDGRPLSVPVGLDATAMELLLNDHAEYSEWVVFASGDNWSSVGGGLGTGTAPIGDHSDGKTHPNIMFASWNREWRGETAGTVTSNADIPTSYMKQVGGPGQFVVLREGGSAEKGAGFKVSRQGEVTGGTFTITMEEGTTAAIAYDADAATFETALQLVRAEATVDGGIGSVLDPWILRNGVAVGNVGDNQTPKADASLVGAAAAETSEVRAAEAGRDAVQTVRVSTAAASGEYALMYGSEGPVEFTPGMSAAAFKTAVEKFVSLSTAADTTVDYDAESGLYTITYVNDLGDETGVAMSVFENKLELAAGTTNARVDQRPTGPSDYSSKHNWTLGRLPQEGDDVVIDDNAADITYGLLQHIEVRSEAATELIVADDGLVDFRPNQIVRVAGATIPDPLAVDTDYYVAAVDQTNGTFSLAATENGGAINITEDRNFAVGTVYNSLTISSDASGDTGRREQTGEFREYRQRYLRIRTLELLVGVGAGQQSGLTRVDVNAGACRIDVVSTAASTEDGFPACNILCDNSTSELVVTEGSAGLAAGDTESSTIGQIKQHGGDLIIGDVSAADLVKFAGTVSARSLTTTGAVKLNG